MVTHINLEYDKLPFKVIMRSGVDLNKEYMINRFTTNPEPDFIEDFNLTEYDNLSVIVKKSIDFEENKEVQFHMDCFDSLDILEKNNLQNIESGEKDFVGYNEEVTIHRHLNNDVGVSLIPGVYKITVIYNDQIYYSQLRINPKNMKSDEHEQLILDIENLVTGLARDWMRKNRAIDLLIKEAKIIPTNIDKALYLIENITKVNHALITIKNSPYKEITKEYLEQSIYKNVKLDSKSIKLNLSKSNTFVQNNNLHDNTKVYAYSLKDDYNNKVNTYLYKVIVRLLKVLKYSQDDFDELYQYVSSDLKMLNRYNFNENIGNESKIYNREKQLHQVTEIKEEIGKLENKLIQFKNFLIRSRVSTRHNKRISQQFIHSPGYNYFYRISQILDNNNGKDNNYLEYTWKPTEVLYEYWCFLKLIYSLEKIGFIINKGWNFNEKVYKYQTSIPDGTIVELEKDEYKLNLIFNKGINKKPIINDETISPYWIRLNRNKPDFRLDIYHKGIFQKTIILDAKYSLAANFWKKHQLYGPRPSKVVEQLKIYANHIYNVHNKRENVVELVLALSPSYINGNKKIDIDTNHSLGVVTFKPNDENVEFQELLEKYIFNNFV